MIPTFILTTWLSALISISIISGGVYLAHEWQQHSWGWDERLQRSVFAPTFGWNQDTALFAGAALLLIVALFGGALVRAVLKRVMTGAKTSDQASPLESPHRAGQQTIKRPDGTELHVEMYGPTIAVPIVLTHGWGLHSAEWNEAKRELGGRFRLITWDEPGLGRSTRPANRDFSLEKMAHDLAAVLTLVQGKHAVLVGHSIGGMIILTFCGLFPNALQERVAGLVLSHTTPRNPVRTTKGAAFFTAIEKPVLVPLLYLTIFLSPIVWLMNWLSYWNGTAHLITKFGSFAGTETWEQVEFATQFQPKASPAVLARGMLGMMNYDATATLPGIKIPTLVVTGDKDTTTKPEAGEEIRAAIPGASLLTLRPAKHLGLIEHHRTFAGAVAKFADGVEATKVAEVL